MKAWMVVPVLGLLAGGCAWPSQQVVNAIDAGYTLIEGEYRGYVSADGRLSEEQKATKLRTADELRKTIEEAKAR